MAKSYLYGLLNSVIVYLASIATASVCQNQNLLKWMHTAAGAVFVALGLRLAREKL